MHLILLFHSLSSSHLVQEVYLVNVKEKTASRERDVSIVRQEVDADRKKTDQVHDQKDRSHLSENVASAIFF